MMLQGKVAVVYGAGGNVGAAVAKAFAADGAQLFLAGRTLAKLQRTAEAIEAAGGMAEIAELDSLDGAAVEQHAAAVAGKAGRIDISINACSIGAIQGTPLHQMPVEDFMQPVTMGPRAHFITATAAARRMVEARSGVILTISTTAAALSGRDRKWHKTGGFGTACAAIEELSRTLAGELGPFGVRVVCLRPDALPETWSPEHRVEDSETRRYMEGGTALGSLPTLQQVSDAAVWAASDRAAAMTGAILNLSRGSAMSPG